MSTLSVATSLSNSSLAAHQPPSNLIPAFQGGPRRERSSTSLAAQYRRHRPSDDSTPLHVACMQRDGRTACARNAMSREAPEAFTGWSLMASCGNRRLLPLGSRRAAGLLGRIKEAVHDGACSPVAMLHLMASRGSDIHRCRSWLAVLRRCRCRETFRMWRGLAKAAVTGLANWAIELASRSVHGKI